MRKLLVLILIVIVFPVFLTGCFKVKDVTYTDPSGMGGDMDKTQQSSTTTGKYNAKIPGFVCRTSSISLVDSMDKTQQSFTTTGTYSVKIPGFVCRTSNISLIDSKVSDPGSKQEEGESSAQGGGIQGIGLKKSFKSLEDFDSYIQDLMKQSDTIMLIVDQPGCTKRDLIDAVQRSKSLSNVVKKIEVPEDIIKTNDGRYFARKYVKEGLESTVLDRTTLLELLSKNINRTNKALNGVIESLENGSIPAKQGAFNMSRQGMMEEEGYVWDEIQKKYVPKGTQKKSNSDNKDR